MAFQMHTHMDIVNKEIILGYLGKVGVYPSELSLLSWSFLFITKRILWYPHY